MTTPDRAALQVVRPGPMTLVQDRGRPGLAHFGVGASGAMDRGSLALGNRLVGNPEGSAGLEVLVGGAEFAVTEPLWFAVTGARGDVAISGHAVEFDAATLAQSGETVCFGTAEHGIRYYLAVRGGIDAEPVLGSRARDTLAKIGPAPLAEGQILPVGAEPGDPIPAIDVVPVEVPPSDAVAVEIRPGPRRDWFGDGAWGRLVDSEWRVSPRSDRTGIRLEGPALNRVDIRELPSEGMIAGAIQVSPDGAPTILGPDHPVTGGYPVIAVVTDATLDALAQVRPGQGLRFRVATGRS